MRECTTAELEASSLLAMITSSSMQMGVRTARVGSKLILAFQALLAF